ncbi:MAG: cell division protein FtsL [Saprospiraceae bacterium]|jgi:cell division protein FtsL
MSNILDEEINRKSGILPQKEKRILWMNVVVFIIIMIKSFFLVSSESIQGVFAVIAMIGFFVMFLGIRITTTYWRKYLKKLSLVEKILLLFPLFNFILLAFSSITRIVTT